MNAAHANAVRLAEDAKFMLEGRTLRYSGIPGGALAGGKRKTNDFAKTPDVSD
jgi:hypothetical protein